MSQFLVREAACDIRIVFITDRTGSMSSYLSSLSRTLPPLFDKVQDLFKGKAKIEVISYSDHGDTPDVLKNCYGTPDEVAKFAAGLRIEGGGGPEATKTALNELYTRCTTGPAMPTIAIMYADRPPHSHQTAEHSSDARQEKAYLSDKKPGFDWFDITRALHALDVTTYTLLPSRGYREHYACLGTVFALSNTNPDTISNATMSLLQRGLGVRYTNIDGFAPNCMMSFKHVPALDDETMKEDFSLLGKWEVVEEGFTSTREVTDEVEPEVMRRPAPPAKEKTEADNWRIVAVKDARTVAELCAEKGLPFKRGGGYYELSRQENISAGKVLVAVDEDNGTVVTGAEESRKVLGLPEGSIKVAPADVKTGWTLYVQSTSYNRKLLAGTTALIFVGEDYADQAGSKRKREEPKDAASNGAATNGRAAPAAKPEPAATPAPAPAPARAAPAAPVDDDSPVTPPPAKKTKASPTKRAPPASPSKKSSPRKKGSPVRKGSPMKDAITPSAKSTWVLDTVKESETVVELCKSKGLKYNNGCVYCKLGARKQMISAVRRLVCFKDGAAKPELFDFAKIRALCKWGEGSMEVTNYNVPEGMTVYFQVTAPSNRPIVNSKIAIVKC